MSPVPPKKIRHLETIWIPMSDGVRLAGRLWLPCGTPSVPTSRSMRPAVSPTG